MSGIDASFRLVLAGYLLGILVMGACREPRMEDFAPERLPSIPETATWAGWVDGGAWIECSFDPEENADWCTAWNDQTGSVMIRTYFVLRDTGEGAPEHELAYSFFSGHHIELADGRILEPRQGYSEGRDPWEPPPIDPPRGSPPAGP